MSKKPESRRQRRLRKYLETNYRAKFFKVWGGPFMDAGLPDLIGCLDGRFVCFEVKEPGNEPSKIQTETLKEFAAVGALVGVVTNEAEIDEIIRGP